MSAPTLNAIIDDILQAILPEQLLDGSPTGFSVTGHIGGLGITSPMACADPTYQRT